MFFDFFKKSKFKNIDIMIKDSKKGIQIYAIADNVIPLLHMSCLKYKKSIYIGNIEAVSKTGKEKEKYYNCGYGSRIMNKLFQYAKENNYSLIEGELSKVDEGHIDRLIHFYEKFGFKIDYYKECKGNLFARTYKELNVKEVQTNEK